MPLQEHEIPTVVIIDDLDSWEKDVSTSVIYRTTESGVEDVFYKMSFYDIDKDNLIDDIVELIIKSLSDSLDRTKIEFFIDELNKLSFDTLVSFWTSLKNSSQSDIDIGLFLSSYLVDYINNTDVDFRINIGTLHTNQDLDIEMYISGVKWYSYFTDLYCSNEAYVSNLDTDIEQNTGRIIRLNSDIYTTSTGTLASGVNEFINTSIYSTTSGIGTIESELTSISGNIFKTDIDIYSTCLTDLVPHPTDIKTKSLFVGDFFIDVDKFTNASSIAWVDIVDYLYPIDTNNTHLYVDDVLASGIHFEDIPYGKRMYYNPLEDFYSTGPITYLVHTESIIGEVDEKDFYLLFGYNLKLNEVVDWGPNNNVVVRAEAKNLVFCPNLSTEAFDFTTVDLSSYNLNCQIRPVGYIDFPVEIYPQSTAFFYGKTFTIKLKNVKDYDGNVMEDLEYTFTIKDSII